MNTLYCLSCSQSTTFSFTRCRGTSGGSDPMAPRFGLRTAQEASSEGTVYCLFDYVMDTLYCHLSLLSTCLFLHRILQRDLSGHWFQCSDPDLTIQQYDQPFGEGHLWISFNHRPPRVPDHDLLLQSNQCLTVGHVDQDDHAAALTAARACATSKSWPA